MNETRNGLLKLTARLGLVPLGPTNVGRHGSSVTSSVGGRIRRGSARRTGSGGRRGGHAEEEGGKTIRLFLPVFRRGDGAEAGSDQVTEHPDTRRRTCRSAIGRVGREGLCVRAVPTVPNIRTFVIGSNSSQTRPSIHGK